MRTGSRDPSVLLWLVPILSFLTLAALADDKDKESVRAKFTDQQKSAIRRAFSASKESFDEDDTLHLTYDFESKSDSLLTDWIPDASKTKGRVRWSRGLEGTPRDVLSGLMISDHGMWYHNALWEEVRMEVEYLSVSGMRPGDLVAAAFMFRNGKRTVGSNLGQQLVQISKGRIAGRPIPATAPVLKSEQRYRFGFELTNGVFSAQVDGSTQSDTKKHPKFLKGLTSGRAGLAWKGTIQGFVFRVSLHGKLDPKWAEKHTKKR